MLKPDKTENRPRITYVYDVFETPLPEGERENEEKKNEKYGVEKQETENRSSVDKNPVKSSTSKKFLSSQGVKKQETEKQSTENQATENQPQISTKEISTKKTNTNLKKERKGEKIFSANKKESTPQKEEPKQTFDSLIDEYTNNEDLRNELKEHLKTRKLKKAALTNRAVELSLSELDKIAAEDYEKIQIVRNSIMNGWTGFFPLKKDEHNRLINSLAQHKPSYDLKAYESFNVFEDWDPEDDEKEENFNEDNDLF